MAVLRQNTAEGGTNGTAVTTANSGGTSGDAWTDVKNTWTFSNAQAASGTLSYQCSQVAGTGASVMWDFSSAPLTTHYGRLYLYMTAFATQSHPIFKGLTAGFTSDSWRVDLTASGQVRIRDGAGTALATSTQTITTGAWWRFEWKVVCSSGTGTTDGQITVNVYSGNSTTVSFSVSSTSANTETTSMSYFQAGPALSSPTVPTMYYDELVIDNASFPGPVGGGVNQPPTANAGPDASAEPGTTYTLQGSGTDTDGTITGYSWRQVSGTSVTLSPSSSVAQPSFTVPALQGGDALVFGLIVTDNQGAQSPEDQVTITALPATLFFARGGVWVPQP
jgi:hypothetical protein